MAAGGTTTLVNLLKVKSNDLLVGNGVTGTGSLRVTVASDNTAFGIKVSDGTNTANVKAATIAAVAADPALVVALSPNSQQLTTPATPTSATATSGGSLPSTTYFFKIVAVDAGGGTTPASAEASIATGAGTANTITLTWAPTTGADSYQVWWSTTTNTQASYFPAPINLSTSGTLTNSYVFSTTTGTFTGTIPTTNTTSYVRQSPVQRVTVNNITGTVSLPTGAATSAKQPALGTAGAASADVITVQGIASMTALKVDGSAVTQPVSGTVTIGAGSAAIGTVTVVGTTATGSAGTGNAVIVAGLDGSGNVRPIFTGTDGSVKLATGANTIGKVDVNQVYVEDVASAGGENLFLSGAVRQDTIAATTSADGDYTYLKTNNLGRLYTSTTIDAALPTGTNSIGNIGTVTTVSTVTSLTQMNGQAIAMGTGVRSAGTQRVTIATDDFSSITDSNNSSIVNLASAATYTGTGTDVSAYAQVSVTIFSDQNSGINGLFLQFSQDNVNWNTETRSPVGANVEITLSSPVMARYFRVFYQNSANMTGAFRLQTRLHAIARTPSTKIATTTIWPTDQVSLTNSILSAPSTTNGTVFNSGVIKSSSTSAAATDQSLVVALSPNSPIPTGTNSIGNIGTVSTVTNLSQLGGTAIAMNTGVRSAGTQRVTIATDDIVPVSQSGTWNINNISGTVSLPTGAATETTLASALTALQLIDNAVATPGSAHGTGILQVGGSDGTNATRIRTDASGFVKVAPKDISTNSNNSTTTNLANAAVFTGIGTDVSAFSQVMVNVFASHASAANGLSIQFSQDGTNWDSTNTYTVVATTDFAIIVPITHTYYRLVYTNGATTTTTLRITSLLSSFTTQATIKKVNAAVNLTDTALSTRSVISGTTTGATPSALTDATVKLGSIGIASTDTALVVAIRDGLPTGANAIGKLSVNDGIDIGDVTINNAIGSGAYVRVTDGTNTMPTGDAAARGVFHRITDGTNTAAVKAASTAPAFADPALVVALSPNSQQLTTPSGVPSVATASTGGSLAASTTYFFKLVAVDAGGGTTIPGPEASIATAVGTATNTITITWPPIPGADSYQVWWSTTTGTQGSYFPAPINLSTSGTLTNSYVFSTVTGTFSGTIPTTNTTSFVRKKAIQPVSITPNQTITVTQATAANLNATVTGTVELGATSLAALENISVTVPGTVDLGTVSLTALETITVISGTPNNFQSKAYGAVTTAAPTYVTGNDNPLSLTTAGALRVDGSAVTQPVSIAASVAVTGPLTSAQTLTALTSLTQFNGTAISMKAASTAAVAADTALVVAISPNNAIGLAADDVHDGVAGTTGVMITGFASSATPTAVSADGDAARIWVNRSGAVIVDGYSKLGTATALAALNSTVVIALGGSKSVGVTITAISAPVGTILTPQVSFDGGTNYIATTFDNPATGDKTATMTNAELVVGAMRTMMLAGGATHARVIATSWTSGSATVLLSGSEANDTSEFFAASNNSANRPPVTAQVGGWDGANLRTLTTNVSGHLSINDGGNSLTIDAPVGTPAFVRLSDGTAAISTLPVSIAATVAVSGPLTDTQLRATAVPVSGTLTGVTTVGTVTTITTANLAADDVHDGVAGTTGVMIAGFASSATPTGVSADGDAARLWVSRSGAVIIDGYTKQGTATAISALNGTLTLQLGGSKAAGITITAISTPVGITLTPQVSFDGGTNWTTTAFKNLGNGDTFPTLTNANLIVGVSASIIIGGGASHVRVIALAYGSGSVTVQWSASESVDTRELFVASNNSAQRPISTAQVGGWDGTNLRALSVTTAGAVNIGSIASALPTGTNSIGNIGTVSTVTNLSQLGGTAIAMNTGVRSAGTLRVTIATDDVIGTVTTVSTVTNLSQLGGAAIAMNTGVRSAGTQRVTIATDDVVQTKATPDATGTYAGTNATVTAYATNLVVKASAGTVYMLSGYNSLATAQFIQIHNATALPADASIPSVIFYVPGLSNFSFDFGVYGRFFSTGVVVCNSTTGPTKTIGAANCWFDAQFK